jgi:SAM-dependent MidA family methyltransferase
MSPLSEIISREITQHGVLPFPRFMELALYCPKRGYYETKKDNPGRHGDFFTSVGVGETFGQLLAFQFAGWLEEARSAECGVRIVEAGAHDGKLAGDILAWLQLRRPELFEQIEYWILEPSAQRQGWQRGTLKNFIPHVRWFNDFRSLSSSNAQSAIRNPQLNGVIFSNELLDAMPIHRYGWDAANKSWFEWGVAVEDGKFVWAKIQPAACRLPPWSRCFPTATSSRPVPPRKTGGEKRRIFWSAEN